MRILTILLHDLGGPSYCVAREGQGRDNSGGQGRFIPGRINKLPWFTDGSGMLQGGVMSLAGGRQGHHTPKGIKRKKSVSYLSRLSVTTIRDTKHLLQLPLYVFMSSIKSLILLK